jgi:hypothetical protein
MQRLKISSVLAIVILSSSDQEGADPKAPAAAASKAGEKQTDRFNGVSV